MDTPRISMTKFWSWHVKLASAVRQEPGLLTIFVVLPFTIVALIILNQRVNLQGRILSELRQDLTLQRVEMQRQYELGYRSVSDRIELVERTIYVDMKGEIDKKIQPSGAAAWQRQRDIEIRNRLSALERWRLEQGR